MPTILFIRGWRLFFYHNERNEPPHIHAQKGGADCKYWLHPESFDLAEAYSYNMSPADHRAIRQIIFEHFDYIVSEYVRFHEGDIK
jgi:hypothetical protein